MSILTPLQLPKAQLQLSSNAGRIYVQCLLRQKKIILTQEEWVRQHLIYYFQKTLNYPLEKMAIEKEIKFDGFIRRWDIVVYDSNFMPYILVECKAPQIKITHEVFMQISTYQSKVQAPYLILSNGIDHLIYQVDDLKKRLERLDFFPPYMR